MNLTELSEVNFEDIAGVHNQVDQLRTLRRNKLFVLLLGPSGVGKTTIIQALNDQTNGTYPYISPYITRDLRPGETEKTSISDAEFDRLEQAGEFVIVNALYGVRYGTPLKTITNCLTSGRVPILDFPLEKVSKLRRGEFDLLNIYVFPPNIAEWRSRLDNANRNNSNRFEQGIEELGMLSQLPKSHPDIHYSVVSRSGDIPKIANTINTLISSI